jgi:Fic family protein
MAQFQVRRWAYAGVDGAALSRKDRRGCDYRVYLPDPLLHRPIILEGPVAADVADAEVALAGFDARARTLLDTEALARLLLRAESVASSRIEGLEVGPRRLLRADAARQQGMQTNDVTAAEVLANVDAIHYGIMALGPREEISLELILEMHRRLLADTRIASHGGVIRQKQNWIGGSDYNPCAATFVPPPPDLVRPLLDDLIAFCNSDDLPAVAQAAIAHAQFETIHPFADGNGRIGRALIHLVLRRRGVITRTLTPISLILATDATAYIDSLQRIRYEGDPMSTPAVSGLNQWIGRFAAAAHRAVVDATSFEMRLEDLERGWRERLGRVRAGSSVDLLLKRLPGMPLLTIQTATTSLSRSTVAVTDAVNELVQAQILRPTTNAVRYRTFEARELIEAFIDFERLLASPAGDTRIAKPTRHVPRRP